MLITSNTSSGIYPDWWRQWKYPSSPYCFLLFLSHLIGQPLTLSSNNRRLRSKGSADSLLLMKTDCLTKTSRSKFCGVWDNDVGSRHQLLAVNLCCPCALFMQGLPSLVISHNLSLTSPWSSHKHADACGVPLPDTRINRETMVVSRGMRPVGTGNILYASPNQKPLTV